MICSICLENIKLIYFKNNYKCKIYYNLSCIDKLYKYKKKCIICDKKFNKKFKNLIKKYQKINELFIYISIIFVIFIYYIINYKIL